MKLNATAVRKLQSYFHCNNTQHKFSECGIALYDMATWFIYEFNLVENYPDYHIAWDYEGNSIQFEWHINGFDYEVDFGDGYINSGWFESSEDVWHEYETTEWNSDTCKHIRNHLDKVYATK